MELNLRGIRGAINCFENSVESISEATKELITALMIKNGIVTTDIISVLFTTTPDLNAAFPAKFARAIGFENVPMMCASEIDVKGAMPMVIRVLLHVQTTLKLNQIHHVYLRDTSSLRDDSKT